MVIVLSRDGRLANRLWQTSHFLANAIEYGYTVYYPCFDEYYDFFDESIRENTSKAPLRIVRTNRLAKALLKQAGNIAWVLFAKLHIQRLNLIWAELVLHQGYEVGIPDYDMNNRSFTEKAKGKVLFVWGWLPRDHQHVRVHRQRIVQFWQPNACYSRAASSLVASARGSCDRVIGVHIRRGDYQYFNSGIWYFDDSRYAEVLRQIVQLEQFRGLNVGFILCSNDAVCSEQFGGLTVWSGQRHVMVDLCLLSLCDYIVGPPSTFSSWAGYVGRKPLLTLATKDQAIRYEDFQVPYC